MWVVAAAAALVGKRLLANAPCAGTAFLNSCIMSSTLLNIAWDRHKCHFSYLVQFLPAASLQEARALFFNPRPTALSLATALLDFFRVVEQLWPEGIFVPQQHEVSLDAAAAHMADPAAQLALAMLRCAGRAMADVGAGACRESLLCGLHVGYDMVQQISGLLDAGLLPAHEGLAKQLQQSPSLPQLMLALLAVETHRLNQQLGISETDSCILLQPKQPRQSQNLDGQRSKRGSRSSHTAVGLEGDSIQQQQGLMQQRLSTAGSLKQSRRCSSALESPTSAKAQQQQDGQQVPHLGSLKRTLSQQRLLEQQQLQQQRQEEEEHEEIEGAGELHQIWHQVLGMARKNLARDGDAGQQREQEDVPRSPLVQLWVSLGLPKGLLQLAADAPASAGASRTAPAQQYMAVCRVGKFLLQGSPLLQPQHAATAYDQRPPSPGAATAALAVPALVAGNSHPGGISVQLSVSAAASATGEQLSPFAGLAARPASQTQSYKGAGALPQAWLSSSPSVAATPPAAAIGAAYTSGGGDQYHVPASVSSLSPRDTLQVGGAFSVSAEAAEQLMDACRDTGLKGQEQLELLRLQRVVPVVLLNTAAGLLQRQAAAAAAGTDTTAVTSTTTTSNSSKLTARQELDVVHAACAAAACVSRCWPVLQKVAEQQEELVDLLAECHPPAGVYAGLTSVCWRPYTLPTEVRLPVLPLLQLVVKLIWQLQPAWQQQQQSVMLPMQPPQQQQGVGAPAATLDPGSSSSRGQILSPVSGECLDSLLEVLTAVSKLPWGPHHEPHTHTSHNLNLLDDAASDSSSVQSAGDVDALLVAEAWKQECQPVAAAVEACLRTAGQVAAAADGAADWKPRGLSSSTTTASSIVTPPGANESLSAAAAAAGPKVQRHPSAVALGSCLASLCAPFGCPGPLVAAAAAAEPGGPAQQQLFALYVSKLKVLLYNPASKKASLIAMHPIEQVGLGEGWVKAFWVHAGACFVPATSPHAAVAAPNHDVCVCIVSV